MSLNKDQFQDLIKQVLTDFDPLLCFDSAINLLLGTAAQESQFGTQIRQFDNGPARGIFQMEPQTFEWLRELYTGKYPEIADRHFEELEWDLRLAIIFARLRYWAVPYPLPLCDDLLGLAKYWKTYYNTSWGVGTTTEFITNYKRFVVTNAQRNI